MRTSTIISHDDAARRLEDALRIRVGRGKRFSFQGLADSTGIAPRTLESYVQGATPGLAALLSLCSVLGPSFTSDVLAPCGQVAHEANPDDPDHMRIAAVMGHGVAKIAEAMADGYVDHRETAQLSQWAAKMIEALEPLVHAQGGSAVQFRGRSDGGN